MSVLLGAVALAGSTIITYRDVNKKNIALKKERKKFKLKFQQFMEAANKQNKIEQTYEVLDYISKNYGCDAIISIPIGYNIKTLLDLIPALELMYNADIIIEPSSHKNSAYMRVHYIDREIAIKDNIKFKWYKCMNNIEKSRNSVHETFEISNITEIKDFNKEICGYELNINIPNGLDYHKITSNMSSIKDALMAKRVFINYNQDTNKLIIKSIYIPIADDLKFKPIKTDSVMDMYIGMSYNYSPVILHFRVLSHLIYTGMPNSGKTVALLTGLTNHIYWYSDKQWELYLAQISYKKDLAIFKDVKQCRYYADNIIKAYKLLLYLYKMYEFRNKKFVEYFEKNDVFIGDIYDWNKYNSHNKMKEVFFASDEFSSYVPDESDNENTIALKSKCLSLLLKLFKEARSSGIHICCSLQRPDKESLDPKIKQTIGNIVSFKQPNIASSLTVLGDDSAFYLAPQREAIVEANERYLMKTLFLSKEDILKYISKSIDKSHKNYINLDDEMEDKLNENIKDSEKTNKQRKRHSEYLKRKKSINIDNKRKLPSSVIRN